MDGSVDNYRRIDSLEMADGLVDEYVCQKLSVDFGNLSVKYYRRCIYRQIFCHRKSVGKTSLPTYLWHYRRILTIGNKCFYCSASFLRKAWPHGGRQLYLIDTILVQNQTISRTLCVEPPFAPLWTPPGSPYRMHSVGGGTYKHSDAEVK